MTLLSADLCDAEPGLKDPSESCAHTTPLQATDIAAITVSRTIALRLNPGTPFSPRPTVPVEPAGNTTTAMYSPGRGRRIVRIAYLDLAQVG